MTILKVPKLDAQREAPVSRRAAGVTMAVAGDDPDEILRMTQIEVVDRISFLEWSKLIPTAKGVPLDFLRWPFQPEIYEVLGSVEVEDADVMKSTQVGVSEMLNRLALYFSDQYGATSLYVFPALKQMWEFSSTRVDPLREGSEYLRGRTSLAQRWPWNKGLKRIGTLLKSGFVHYRGSESKNELISVDADVVCLDEYDSLAPMNVPEAERRVGGSALGLIRRVGVPSHPEFGIAKRYNTSDKRTWMVKCGRCRAGWQPLLFEKNVVWDEDDDGIITNPAVVCWKCEEPLNVLQGEWVAEHPSRRRPGFHVNRLMVPGERNLRNVIENSKLRLPHQRKSFANNDLGIPYADETGGLDRAVLAAAVSMAETWLGHPMYQADTPGYQGTNFVTMGVDVASARALNIRISEHIDSFMEKGHRKRALFIGTADSFDEVVELMIRYKVTIAVIDHLPEMRLALGVCERFPGRAYIAHYSTSGKQVEPLVVNTETRSVSVLRVPAMDATAAVMRGMRNLLPEDVPDDYVDNMLSPRREIEKDEFDRVTVKWGSKGPDDFYQSEVYDLIATEVLKVRLEVEALEEQQGQVVEMDQQLEYRRTGVNDYEDQEYRPGPGGDEYRPGPGD